MTLKKAFVFILCVFLASVLLSVTGVAKRFEYVDVPLHILGGLGWAMVAVVALHKTSKQPWWIQLFFTIGVVLLVGLLWEFAEFAAQSLLGAQTWRDTLGDLFNDSLGAILGWIIYLK